MRPELFEGSDGRELSDWMRAEEQAVERLLQLADAAWMERPQQAMQLEMLARVRAQELLRIREWNDLP